MKYPWLFLITVDFFFCEAFLYDRTFTLDQYRLSGNIDYYRHALLHCLLLLYFLILRANEALYSALHYFHLIVLHLHLVASSLLRSANHGTLVDLQSDSPRSSGQILIVFCNKKCIIILKELQNFYLLSVFPRGDYGCDRQTDRHTHTHTHSPETHFIIQMSEMTDRALFVHEYLMLPFRKKNQPDALSF